MTELPGGPYARRPRRGWLDAAVIAAVTLALGLLAWRAGTALDYRWNFAPVWGFVLRHDAERGWVANLLLQGLLTTLRVSFWAAIVAAVVGVAMGIARTSRALLPRLVAGFYVETVRNIPPLVFIFVFYFFVTSQVLPALGVEDWIRRQPPGTLAWIEVLFGPPQFAAGVIAAILCLGLFEGAYVTEIVRAGIQSLPRGQWEAAQALGLSRLAALRHVILPQAFARTVPPLAGQAVSLVKDSSIVSLVSIQDLAFLGNEVAATTNRVFETWLVVAAFYFVVCAALSAVAARLERRFAARN
ncbi:amino acid ABC transporter permease [Falsiroseomonas oryzae]|uniref:amino acid ABC transporter permease n=1 Tax=Falsiroseomonas oryzae TaxID=2766473 RepID=UPI0022EB8CCD|nr:amino acid ABC transporter permease [Roseomonas sp. MO-31]